MRGQVIPIRADAAPRKHGCAEVAPTERLADVLAGPLGYLATQNLRVRPRQKRSIRSVERILSAAADLGLNKGAEPMSIERVASSAGVTPQAAYRYFKDVDVLMRTVFRCIVIREHERIVKRLSSRALPERAEMAQVVVGVVLDTCERLNEFPSSVQSEILREYRQIGCEASLLMSEAICAYVDRLDGRRSPDAVKAAVAIMAIIAVATSVFARMTPPLRGSKLENTLTSLFVSVLQSGGDPSDAPREMGPEFEFC